MFVQSLSPFWRTIHWVIIVNFAIQIIYASYMVFFVVTNGSSGPLFGSAQTMPFEQMMVRRQYATECWIAIVGLSLYLAVTEILPRRLGQNARQDAS